jgi:hypothetical protein
MAMLEKMDTFDWKALAPPVMAQILTKVPFKGKDGVPEYLTLTEAMIFAIRCYELGLSPISRRGMVRQAHLQDQCHHRRKAQVSP